PSVSRRADCRGGSKRFLSYCPAQFFSSGYLQGVLQARIAERPLAVLLQFRPSALPRAEMAQLEAQPPTSRKAQADQLWDYSVFRRSLLAVKECGHLFRRGCRFKQHAACCRSDGAADA